MDCKSLQFEDGSFDAVIDKGTFDSVLCGDGSGPNAELMLNEVHRVLSPSGVYICITYGQPEQRISYFNRKEYDWNVFVQKVAKPTISTSLVVAGGEKEENKNFHFIFIMRKQ
jgi:ubiquinone/menaquinone biosynthesis C-methylase UbiE